MSLTHGLRPPDDAAVSVRTDRVWIIGQQRITGELLLVLWVVDQHGVDHFLFVQVGPKHPQEGLSAGANLNYKGRFKEKPLTGHGNELLQVLVNVLKIPHNVDVITSVSESSGLSFILLLTLS